MKEFFTFGTLFWTSDYFCSVSQLFRRSGESVTRLQRFEKYNARNWLFSVNFSGFYFDKLKHVEKLRRFFFKTTSIKRKSVFCRKIERCSSSFENQGKTHSVKLKCSNRQGSCWENSKRLKKGYPRPTRCCLFSRYYGLKLAKKIRCSKWKIFGYSSFEKVSRIFSLIFQKWQKIGAVLKLPLL